MRTLQVAICACLAGFLAMPLAAWQDKDKDKTTPDVTVILDFKGAHSAVAIREMEREAGLILKASGVRLGWAKLGDNPSASYVDLVVMKFKGACEFQPSATRYDEPGPYARTFITDGEILPFGEVDCDRVVGSAYDAMGRDDFARAEMLIGRALGRVVAHELVHMLTKSTTHGTAGIEKPALTGRQLISAALPLSEFDVDRVRQERASH
jgi:hypothetical protein